MTGTYEWNPMPHKVDIRCPSCGHHAEFEFAEVVRIELKKDIGFFDESDLFDYKVFKDSSGHRWHGALYYAGLHGGTVAAIRDLPDCYKPEDWCHSQYLYRSHGLDIGSVICRKCHLMRKHQLSWPAEAYFSIDYRGKQLWAFDRESAIELKQFIASNDRNVDAYRWRNFLLHVPSEFKQKKAREHVVKQLGRMLEETRL